jgi:hypothetical protein
VLYNYLLKIVLKVFVYLSGFILCKCLILLQIISKGHAKTFDIFHSIFIFEKKQVPVNYKNQLASLYTY